MKKKEQYIPNKQFVSINLNIFIILKWLILIQIIAQVIVKKKNLDISLKKTSFNKIFNLTS